LPSRFASRDKRRQVEIESCPRSGEWNVFRLSRIGESKFTGGSTAWLFEYIEYVKRGERSNHSLDVVTFCWICFGKRAGLEGGVASPRAEFLRDFGIQDSGTRLFRTNVGTPPRSRIETLRHRASTFRAVVLKTDIANSVLRANTATCKRVPSR